MKEAILLPALRSYYLQKYTLKAEWFEVFSNFFERSKCFLPFQNLSETFCIKDTGKFLPVEIRECYLMFFFVCVSVVCMVLVKVTEWENEEPQLFQVSATLWVKNLSLISNPYIHPKPPSYQLHVVLDHTHFPLTTTNILKPTRKNQVMKVFFPEYSFLPTFSFMEKGFLLCSLS